MLRRGFLTHRHPADGGETLWAPGCPEHPARFVVDPRPPRYGMHVPVVYDDAVPGMVDPVVPVVSVIDWHGPAGVEVAAPSGLERLCPAPTVEEYRAAVDDGFTPPLSHRVKDPVLLALTLRMMQLTVVEAQQICRLADAVTPELLDHVHRLGPGLEHSPEFADEALGNLPSTALGSHRRRVLHAVCVATMLARTTGPRTMFQRISADDLRTVLAPFVTVCGPVPGIDVDALGPLRPLPVELQESGPPPVIRARQLHDAVTGTLVWADFPSPPEVGQVVAVFTGMPTFGEVALGTACTHHRITVVNDVESTGQTSVLVAPALPSTEGDIHVMPVDWCRTYLADNPSAVSRPVVVECHPAIQPTSPRPVRRGTRRRMPWKRTDHPHVLLWNAALTEHDRIRERYLQYEMNPELILRYPAVTDVSVDQTAAFHDAAARADALRADAVPADPGHADAYHEAVNELSRRWTQCEDHGRRLGHTHLPTADANDLDRAVKLIRHAAGASTDLERAAYLDRAQTLVDDITSRITVRIGRTALRRLSSLASIPQLSPPSDADTL